LIYIQNHLERKLSLDELAGVAEFSPYHFHRIFRSVVGETVKEHVRRLRLEQAARSLKTSNEPVTNIAFQAGYETHESFSRAFKTMFGVSPSGYRKAIKEKEHFTELTSSKKHLKKLHAISDAEETDIQVKIQEVSDKRVAFVRHIGPYESAMKDCPAILTRLLDHIDMQQDDHVIGIPLDDPSITPPEKLRYDICIPANDDFSPVGDIGVQHIEEGDYAITTHTGKTDSLEETILALFGDWFPLSNREVRSTPVFFEYETGCDGPILVHVPLKKVPNF
jgi:AraC family transcriptional regulator